MKKLDNEAYLISKLHSKHIGDDAAHIDGMLYSTDAFFEDTHFKRKWFTMEQIGRKAMLVNISDAIAMNARPLYALVSVSLPKDMRLEEIDALTKSLDATAKAFGCEIIGGDTVGSDKLHLSITIISKSSHPLYRKGLKEGDLLAYTGILGESKKDLEKLFKGEKVSPTSRFYAPILRDNFIYNAREYLKVGMDISDGLFCDTNTLLKLNNIGINIFENISDSIGLSGEEYEMLIGFSEAQKEHVLKVAEETKTPLTIFGKVAENDFRFVCKSHHF